MNLKEYKKEEYYRVLKNTMSPSSASMNDMIGREFKRSTKYDSDNTIALYRKDEKGRWIFNAEDVQLLTPLEYKGRKIGIGDMVKWCGDWYEVYDYIWYDKKWEISVWKDDGEYCISTLSSSSINDIKPLYKDKVETISIAGHTYNKNDVEEALKDIKEV